MNHPFESLTVILRENWIDDALCPQVSRDEFHASKSNGSQEAINFAKQVCRLCEVKTECLEAALAMNETEGIWGGLSPKARQRIRTSRQMPKPERVDTGNWHGTLAGAQRHYRANERACPDCRRAEARYRKQRREMAS